MKDTIVTFNKGDTIEHDSLAKKIHPKNSDSIMQFNHRIDSIVDDIYQKKHTPPVAAKFLNSIQDADFNQSYVIQIKNDQKIKTVISLMIDINYSSGKFN
jgi:hypothetical protein